MALSYKSRKSKRQAGQAAVEFALTFPVLMIVLTAVMGFAVLFYSYLTMELAVREGTSSITHNPAQTVDNIQTVVRNAMVTLDPSQVSIDVSPSEPSAWVSCVQVSVSALYTVNVPLNPVGPIVFQAQSVMTIE